MLLRPWKPACLTGENETGPPSLLESIAIGELAHRQPAPGDAINKLLSIQAKFEMFENML